MGGTHAMFMAANTVLDTTFILHEMLKAGGDPNGTNSQGLSAFMAVCAAGHQASTLLMLQATQVPIDLSVRSGFGMTPAMMVVGLCSEALLKAFQSHFERTACELDRGVPRDKLWTDVRDNGMCSLMIAAGSHRLDTLCWLLDDARNGGLKMARHLERQDAEGKTSLWHAADIGRNENVCTLLSHSARIDIVDKSGTNLLDCVRSQAAVDAHWAQIEDTLLAVRASRRARQAVDEALANSVVDTFAESIHPSGARP